MTDPQKPAITHVFVLMLENHSFDNILGFSGLPGIAPPVGCSNVFQGRVYDSRCGAPSQMSTDPGHEFADVLEQLCGTYAVYAPGGPYPPVSNCGFASNYATSITEPPHKTPAVDCIADIMSGFDTRVDLPVTYQLASEFAVCDRWFSSMPGPTWPNRFFVHGASSMGLYDSPKLGAEIEWWTLHGFHYNKGSIFQALDAAQVKWRLYNDDRNQFSDRPERGFLGFIPQVAALKGIQLWDVESYAHFADDVNQVDAAGNSLYPYQYTFIEPNWGDSLFDTYVGGSAQHPMDDMCGGERLIKATYEAIRNSPLWNSSLLIITYDEHGGFYDSVPPPKAPSPNDDPTLPPAKGQDLAFTFEQYGVRVPAIIVSPLVAKGCVDHTLYDHSSIAATLERLFDFAPLTDRDRQANDLRHLACLAQPRTDCPVTLADTVPAGPSTAAAASPEEQAQLDARPFPLAGNAAGLMHVLHKAEVELALLASRDVRAVTQKFLAIKTIGDAKAFAAEAAQRIAAFKAARGHR